MNSPERPAPAIRMRGMGQLVLPEDQLARLRSRLLADAPLETACFLLVRVAAAPSGLPRLVVYDTIPVAENAYTVRTPVALEIAPAAIAAVIRRARDECSGVVLVHSHPFAEEVVPSAQDRTGERLLVPAIRRRAPTAPVARLIFGRSGIHAAMIDPPDGDLQVVSVGPNLDMPSIGGSMAEGRFHRQVLAFGERGQARLRALRVGIVGVGGTGSHVVQQLGHLGVRTFLLIDPDVVSSTNLNRLVGATSSEVGMPKVVVAERLLKRLNPDVNVTAMRADARDRLVAQNLLDVDFFFCCTDSHGSRAVLNQLSYQYLVPSIDMGVAVHSPSSGEVRVSGRVQMLAPGLPCLLCSAVLDSEAVRRDLLSDEARAADPYIVGEAIPQPAVISLNGTAASLAVTMMLGAVTGLPVASRSQQIRFECGRVTPTTAVASPNCPICSQNGYLGRADWPAPGRT